MKEIEIDTKDSKEVKVKEKSIIRETVEWVLCFFAAFVVAMLVKYFLFTPTLVCQTSMTPTILDGERVLINRTVRTFKLPLYRNDIVTFERPVRTIDGKGYYDTIDGFWEFFRHDILESGKISYIKRVIGLEGDHVRIENGKVYVNDEKTLEPYLNGISTPVTGEFCDIVVPEDHVFVMGDNRSGSSDSREFGCIPVEKIEGRVSIRIWPLSAFGKIDE